MHAQVKISKVLLIERIGGLGGIHLIFYSSSIYYCIISLMNKIKNEFTSKMLMCGVGSPHVFTIKQVILKEEIKKLHFVTLILKKEVIWLRRIRVEEPIVWKIVIYTWRARN